jgi:hypothetical protein
VNSWQYSFNAAGVVQPLIWKGAFFGQLGYEKHWNRTIVALIYMATPAQIQVLWDIDIYDDSGSQNQQAAITVNPSDFDANGIARIRIQPKNQQALGTSPGLQCSSKITIIDVYSDWEDDAPGIVKQTLSV